MGRQNVNAISGRAALQMCRCQFEVNSFNGFGAEIVSTIGQQKRRPSHPKIHFCCCISSPKFAELQKKQRNLPPFLHHSFLRVDFSPSAQKTQKKNARSRAANIPLIHQQLFLHAIDPCTTTSSSANHHRHSSTTTPTRNKWPPHVQQQPKPPAKFHHHDGISAASATARCILCECALPEGEARREGGGTRGGNLKGEEMPRGKNAVKYGRQKSGIDFFFEF